MAFLVIQTQNNGYRCCCHQSWDSDPEWFSTKEEAFALIPTTIEAWTDDELEEITVMDGTTGLQIAFGKIEWVGIRGQSYSHARWYGNVEGKEFELIKGNNPGESWNDMNARLRKVVQDRKIAEAERQLKELKL